MKTSSHFSSKHSALVLSSILVASLGVAGVALAQLNIPTNLNNAAITIQKIFLSSDGTSQEGQPNTHISLDGLLGNITTTGAGGVGGNVTIGGKLQFTRSDYKCPFGSTGCILKVDEDGVVLLTDDLSGSNEEIFKRTGSDPRNIFLATTDGSEANVGNAPSRSYLRVGATTNPTDVPEKADTAMIVAGNIESRGGLYIKKSNFNSLSNEGENLKTKLEDYYTSLQVNANDVGGINFRSSYNDGSPNQDTSFLFSADGAETEVQIASGGSLLVGPQPGCFLSDTKVTLADGTTQSIQDIKLGDQLKAVNGTNTVMKLLRPTLGNQSVYAINNTESFFTANHPFLTTEGWKSIDPDTTKKEIPDLEVSKLAIGDILITEAGKVLVVSLAPASQSASTQLYNFELDGDHTYFANGYAVHNKLMCIPGDSNLNNAVIDDLCGNAAKGALYANATTHRVGIYNTTPEAELDVNGTGLFRGSMYVKKRAKIGAELTIGYASDFVTSDKLAVNGSTRANAYYYNSDRRYKSDIEVLKSPLANLLKLSGYSYFNKLSQKKDLGVIAQEVESVYPELVQTDAEGYKSVEYGNLVAPIIEAIKELATKIDHLFTLYVSQQAKIDTLEARLLKLESQVK